MMIEARTIKLSEAEPFLRLMCESFGLDFNRANTVFFQEPMFDLDRKWALFDSGKIVSVLTTTPLLFGWGCAAGISGVATRPEVRRSGYAGRLLEHVRLSSLERGENSLLLFARDRRLYERHGFNMLDHVIRARINTSSAKDPGDILSTEEVKRIYSFWSSQDADRLVRDEKRWTLWRWNLRFCHAFNDGYIASEGSLVRECLYTHGQPNWPLPFGNEWLGLRTMVDRLEVPIFDPQEELILMGRGFDQVPQMFMTDQF